MSFLDRIAQIKAEEEAARPAEDTFVFDDDFLEDLGDTHHDPIEQEIDTLIAGISIVDAYNRWCGKMQPKVGRKRESIMVSCPDPAHPDKDPSAWLNLDLGVGNCAKCGGFDIYDIAAWHFGFDVPGYKGDDFPKLRHRIAEEFGIFVHKTPAGSTFVERVAVEDDTVESDKSTAAEIPSQDDSGSPTTDNGSYDEAQASAAVLEFPFADEDVFDPPSIDWPSLIPAGTFLDEWMTKTTAVSDLPDEFYFWVGLVLVGLAGGMHVTLADFPRITSNLFLCLYGPSGIGKTRSLYPAKQLLGVLPYDSRDEANDGVLLVSSLGSAEAMVDAFAREGRDEDGKPDGRHLPVRGLVTFNEFSDLAAKAGRLGSTFKPRLIEFYDLQDEKITHKTRGAGEVIAQTPYCSVVSTTQPHAIRNLINQDDADSGFLNRWVFVAGPAKPLHPLGVGQADLEAAKKLFIQLNQWGYRNNSVELKGAARVEYERFFREELEPIRNGEVDLPLLTRADLLLKRLILIFSINEKTNRPSVDLVRRVEAILPYLKETYRMLGGEIGQNKRIECAERIGAIVRDYEEKHNRGPTWRDIERSVGKRFNIEEKIAGRKLALEVEMIVLVASTPKTGRPTERYISATG